MKKLAVIICSAALATGAFAQGVINFVDLTHPVSYTPGGGAAVALPTGQVGGYWFALLTAPLGTTDPASSAWSFSGIYGTNLNAAGLLSGGNGHQITGWVPGTSRAFEVAGWDSSGGPAWNPSWLTTPASRNMLYYGVSMIAGGAAGGVDPVTGATIPPLNIFGAAPSINGGWTLQSVPEPATMALAGLGAAALLIFRRRK